MSKDELESNKSEVLRRVEDLRESFEDQTAKQIGLMEWSEAERLVGKFIELYGEKAPRMSVRKLALFRLLMAANREDLAKFVAIIEACYNVASASEGPEQ